MTMTIIAWAMIIVFLALVMTKKMQPFTALLLVPLVFTLLGAFLGQYTDLVAAANGVDAASVTLWDQIKIIGDWTRSWRRPDRQHRHHAAVCYFVLRHHAQCWPV